MKIGQKWVKNQAKIIKTGKIVDTKTFCFPLPISPVFRCPEIAVKIGQNSLNIGKQNRIKNRSKYYFNKVNYEDNTLADKTVWRTKK